MVWKMAKVEVGQIWTTKLYGDVEILGKVKPCIFIGRFVRTGYITKPSQASSFYYGKITDFMQKYKLEPQYGYWSVIREVERHIQPNGTIKRRVECKCICGKVKLILLDSLTRGTSTNCGCVSMEQSEWFHGESGERLYECWLNMKGRCKKRGGDCNYHPDWESYLPFKEWSLRTGYDETKILLRGTSEYPDQGDYTPDNCRWGTKVENYLDWKRALEISENK